MTEQSTVYSQLMALRDRQRALQAESPFVIRGAQLPWESNPQGTMRWYLHPAMQQCCHKALIFSVQKIYSSVEIMINIAGGRGEHDFANREGTSPNHQLSLQSRFTWEQWEFDTWYRYVERLPTLHVPGYHTLNVRIGWHLSQSLSIDAIGQNLLDITHTEFRTTSGGTQPTDVQRAGLVRLTWRY